MKKYIPFLVRFLLPGSAFAIDVTVPLREPEAIGGFCKLHPRKNTTR